MTVLQWLALSFQAFAAHPLTSKAAFTDYIQMQKILHGDTANKLSNNYHEARQMINPYLIQPKVYHVCVNDCIICKDNGKTSYAHLDSCPQCKEPRYASNVLENVKLHDVYFTIYW